MTKLAKSIYSLFSNHHNSQITEEGMIDFSKVLNEEAQKVVDFSSKVYRRIDRWTLKRAKDTLDQMRELPEIIDQKGKIIYDVVQNDDILTLRILTLDDFTEEVVPFFDERYDYCDPGNIIYYFGDYFIVITREAYTALAEMPEKVQQQLMTPTTEWMKSPPTVITINNVRTCYLQLEDEKIRALRDEVIEQLTHLREGKTTELAGVKLKRESNVYYAAYQGGFCYIGKLNEAKKTITEAISITGCNEFFLRTYFDAKFKAMSLVKETCAADPRLILEKNKILVHAEDGVYEVHLDKRASVYDPTGGYKCVLVDDYTIPVEDIALTKALALLNPEARNAISTLAEVEV